MKTILLTQGKFAKVSDEWYETLSAYKWFAFEHHGNWYAARNIWFPDPTKKTGVRIEMIRMHRQVMGCTKGDGVITDHRDGDGLNNQVENLRATNASGNARNCKKRSKENKYKGVHKNPHGPSFNASMRINGKDKCLGSFATEEDAALAWNIAAVEHHGIFARLNVLPTTFTSTTPTRQDMRGEANRRKALLKLNRPKHLR